MRPCNKRKISFYGNKKLTCCDGGGRELRGEEGRLAKSNLAHILMKNSILIVQYICWQAPAWRFSAIYTDSEPPGRKSLPGVGNKFNRRKNQTHKFL